MPEKMDCDKRLLRSTKKKGGTGSSAFVKKRMERLIFLEETNVIQGRYDSYFFHSYLNIVLIVTLILNLQHDFKY